MEPAPRLRDPSELVSPRARLMWMVGGFVRAAVLMAALLVTSLVFDWYDLRWWMPVALGPHQRATLGSRDDRGLLPVTGRQQAGVRLGGQTGRHTDAGRGHHQATDGQEGEERTHAGVTPQDGRGFACFPSRLARMEPAPRLRDPSELVSPRARLMWTVGGLVRSAVLMAALLVTSLVFDWYDLQWWMPVLLGAVTLAAAFVIPQWRYLVHRWEVTDTAVYTQTGWWRRERRIAPMSRIQTVDYVEGAIARLFGLASVTVTTASAAGALEIAGLDRDRARAVVDELTVKADTIPGDAT